MSKLKARSVNIYAQVLEPFLFTKYIGIDPEIPSGSYDIYPRYRTFLMGVKIGL
jgi:hypothetical protein